MTLLDLLRLGESMGTPTRAVVGDQRTGPHGQQLAWGEGWSLVEKSFPAGGRGPWPLYWDGGGMLLWSRVVGIVVVSDS